MFNLRHRIYFYSFVVFSIVSASLFITEGNLFAVSSIEERSDKQAEKIKKDNKYQFLYETGPFEGYVAPDFTLPDIHGQSISLSQFNGKVVFLNIWATWCGPCRKEMPDMEKLYQKFKKENFEILAVSIDRQGKLVVMPFLKELGLTFPVLLDPDSSILKVFKINSLPSSIIIDKMGFIDMRVIGARDWFSPEIIENFEDLLNEPSMEPEATIEIKG